MAGAAKAADGLRTENAETALRHRNDALSLLRKFLILNTFPAESKVFYLKPKGHDCRHLVEVDAGEDKKRIVGQSQPAYQETFEISKKEMPPTQPLCSEILNSPERGFFPAETAFNEATAELESLSAEWNKDSTLIIQILRDGLMLWTSDTQGDKQKQEGGA